MTLEEKQIALAEWMDFCGGNLTNYQDETLCDKCVDKGCHPKHAIPKLTLDWLHECEERLHSNYNLSETYVSYLRSVVYETKHSGCSIDFALLNATKEQRLNALLKTIGKL